MEGQVERALARARMAAAGGLQKRRCAVAPVVRRLVGALSRLPAAPALEWQVAVDEDVVFPGDEGDLMEILGNLLDNARKWGRGQVVISGSVIATRTSLTIDDDGPGMTLEEMRGIGRGQRWDESKPGTGFGLAIARDLAEATGALMQVAGSPFGGLRVILTWT
ncbi:ATP-binding protein [Methylobacterium nigriterrae]|uniref:ATP-binding protein n=1 Tax=Methylobacterium nigriterrae TaxID=3127512 RepID=UPI003013A3BA